MLTNYLPTYEDCLKIVKNNESFKIKEEIYNGKKVTIFNYMLAQYNDFETPLTDDKEIDAFELRGITFVHESETEINRFLMLHKFFNMDQVKGYMTDDLRKKDISVLEDKRDGSMIGFIKVNGEVIPKTKQSLGNEQTEIVRKIYNNDSNLRKFVNECIDNDIVPIFELTSPFNRIVLEYFEDELKLLQLRDGKTGNYFDITNNDLITKYEVPVVDTYSVELEKFKSIINDLNKMKDYKRVLEISIETFELWKLNDIEVDMDMFISTIDMILNTLRKNDNGLKNVNTYNLIDLLRVYNTYVTNKEGMIAKTTCGQFFKAKTDWYFENHRLLTTDLSREDFIIEKTLEDEIDDILAQLHEKDMTRVKVESISLRISTHYNHVVNEVWGIVKKEKGNVKKDIATKYKKEKYKYFGVLMSSIGENEERVEKLVKDMMLKETNKLEKARLFLEKI